MTLDKYFPKKQPLLQDLEVLLISSPVKIQEVYSMLRVLGYKKWEIEEGLRVLHRGGKISIEYARVWWN